jgi:hypothetical protein
MRRFCVATLAAALLALPAAAHAQEVPPGNSGVDQYLENLPGPGGDKPSNDVGGGGGGGGGNLPPGVAEDLEAQGPNGAAAAALAEQTVPEQPKGNAGDESAKGPSTGGDVKREDDGSSLGDIFSALAGSDSGGMGIFLPILLAGTLLCALVLIVTRARRGDRTGEA